MTHKANSDQVNTSETITPRSCTINFGAGPATLPETVLNQFTKDLINFKEAPGLGIAELSHRSEAFEREILAKASGAVYELSGYTKEEWAVLWMSGGGTGQFSGVPMNFDLGMGRAVYLVTGIWSQKAGEEAKRILGDQRVIMIDLRTFCDSNPNKSNNTMKIRSLLRTEYWIDQVLAIDSISYIYYCDNETVDGIELPDSNYFQNLLEPRFFKENGRLLPVFIGDLSSNFFSRKLPDPNGLTGLVFGGVQKNLGAAGVTLVMIKRKVLEERISAVRCPSILDYKMTEKNNSLLNTPPVMAIHLCNLVLQNLLNRWGKENGNDSDKKNYLEQLNEFSIKKSKMIYGAIEESSKFYCPVDKQFQSRMNVTFKALDDYKDNSEVTDEFLKKAQAKGMIQLKGHRSVGGLRASLYNAIEIDQVQKLVDLLNEN